MSKRELLEKVGELEIHRAVRPVVEDLSAMKLEDYYCSFCGSARQKVVRLGEVAAGLDNVEVYICGACMVVAAKLLKEADKHEPEG